MAGGAIDDVNLVPYLDIVTTLTVAFLILGTTVVSGVVLVQDPIDVPGGGLPDAPRAALFVHLGVDRIRLMGDAGTLDLPANPDGSLPMPELTRTLRSIHDNGGAAATATLSAEPGLPFVTVVGALDAMREDAAGELYPAVSLATPGASAP